MKRLILGSLSLVLLSSVAPFASAETLQTNTTITSPSLQAAKPTTTLKIGNFVNGEHPTSGGVSIVEENGQRYLEFDQDFRTDNGPDLFVVLHRSSDVIGTTSSPAHSLKEGDYLTIAPLQTITGKQRYAIPANVKLSDYNSVAVWCRRFNATFGAASLNTASEEPMAAIVKSGDFLSGEHPTSGKANIVVENGQRYLEFDQDFRTDSGPDLFVVLHRSGDVIGSSAPPAYGLKEGEYLTIAPLQTTTGKQRYAIPADVKLSDYNSVAVWCRRFNATFGAASLM